MKEVVFLLCVLAVTAYLAVTAWEDYRTCEVTRWKHLWGSIPAICVIFLGIHNYSAVDYAGVLVFALLFIGIGYIGVYGVADGFVFANLTLFFGGIGGVIGIGIAIWIMIMAGVSFLINHLFTCMIKKKKLFQNIAAAFIPHIFVGYIAAGVRLLTDMVA